MRAACALLFALAACAPAPLAGRVLGRYVARLTEGVSVLELRRDGAATLVERSNGGPERSDGRYVVARDTLYVTLEPRTGSVMRPFSFVLTLRGDTLAGRMHYVDVSAPFVFVRER